MQAAPPSLALILQEAFTAVERLRSNRVAISNAAAFRAQMLQLLQTADQEARNAGYQQEDIRLAAFAIVGFLDESILNLQLPVFSDWARKPLQEELFGGHVAGEIFFQSLQRLMERPDSPATADVLEVFVLCILLGYRGRYGAGGQAELKALLENATLKIRRIRGASSALSPAWMPPAGQVNMNVADPWVKRMAIAAIASAALVLILFGVYKIALNSGINEISAIAASARR